MLERTHRKLREAHFFLGRFRLTEKQVVHEHGEELHYYLSAFLCAARSVGDYAPAEEGGRYRAWWANQKIDPADKDLMAFFNDERVESVHVRGPNVEPATVWIPMEMSDESWWWHSPTPTAKASARTLRFEAHHKTPIPELADRYLTLMERLLGEYEAAHAVEDEK